MAIADTQTGSAFNDSRRYDLDWLRVIAFGLLIFYHVGMFYVTWDWHVKSIYAGPAAEPLMLTVNPWRLALLFFISGVAVRFASDKAGSKRRFAASRLLRLGLPILAGMVVIVTPQAYFQLRYNGEIEPGYFAFWADYLKLEQAFSITTPTWNHLWYVVYLLAYILLITPLLPLMRRFAEGMGGNIVAKALGGPGRLLLIVPIPFITYGFFLEPNFPTTHDFINDWANHAHRFTIFLLGYFAAKNVRFWGAVDRAWIPAAALVVLISIFRFYMRAYEWDLYVMLHEKTPIMTIIVTLYAWSFIVMLLGIGQRYLNQPSRALTYLTGAVFCYYILHQTIIVAAGYYLTQLQLGVWPEFILVMSATILGCGAGYELSRRIPILRVFLGIKAPPPQQKVSRDCEVPATA